MKAGPRAFNLAIKWDHLRCCRTNPCMPTMPQIWAWIGAGIKPLFNTNTHLYVCLSRFPRGASFPPMVCEELSSPKPPVAPPRSRRGSTQSVHLLGLSDRVESFQSTVERLKSDLTSQGLMSMPVRPPRRNNRFKKKDFSTCSTLPRNFKTSDLGKISGTPNILDKS